MDSGSTATAGAAAPPAEGKPRLGVGDHRHNNFDVLRLLAASAVLFSHSFALTSHGEPVIGNDSVGRIGVLMFFAMSGFLVAESWRRQPGWNFLAKRALRIMPAFAVVLLLTTLVLGPLVTTLSTSDYFSSGQTWHYLFDNLRFHSDFLLPGVFAENPYPDVVNGSLWTLPSEIHVYIMITIIGFIGILKSQRLTLLVFLGVCLLPVVAPGYSQRFLGDPFLVRAFCIGVLLLIWRDEIPWKGSIAAGLAAAWAALTLVNEDAGQWLGVVAVAYVTIYVAYNSPLALRKLTSKGDVSYGLYLYAFPVQQVILELWPSASPVAVIALSFPVTYVLAFASWKIIEHPALQLKSRLQRPGSEPTPLPAPALVEHPGVVYEKARS
jgi:peptidoglycan/LPS O-acetylase OafA/YrhL